MPPQVAEAPADKLAPALRRLKVVSRATPEAGDGTFEALVSSYAETYEIGWFWQERIMPGCFAESIAAHAAFPVCWNHQWALGPIGDALVTELDLGLLAKGSLYLDLDPLVARLYRAMVAEAVTEWSIAFYPEAITWTDDEPEVDQIEKGDLIEVTACFRGANPGTETIDLRNAPVLVDGGEDAARREVIRLRSLSGRPDFGSIAARAAAVPGVPAGGAAADPPAPPPAAEPESPAIPSAAVGFRAAKVVRRHERMRGRLVSARAEAGMAEVDDEDPDAGDLAKALDAVIDEIEEALEDGDLQGATDLATAADSTSDDLLEALGVPDDDDLEEGEGTEASMDSATAAQLLSSRVGRELLARVASGPPRS